MAYLTSMPPVDEVPDGLASHTHEPPCVGAHMVQVPAATSILPDPPVAGERLPCGFFCGLRSLHPALPCWGLHAWLGLNVVPAVRHGAWQTHTKTMLREQTCLTLGLHGPAAVL